MGAPAHHQRLDKTRVLRRSSATWVRPDHCPGVLRMTFDSRGWLILLGLKGSEAEANARGHKLLLA